MFSASRLKIARAREKLDDLSRRIDQFLSEEPYGVVDEAGPEADEHVIRAKVHRQPDAILGVISGEIAHHLRSALDYAVGELIERETGQKPATAHAFEFPIFIERTKFAHAGEKIKGVGKAAAEAFERMQPFNSSHPECSTLWMLHRIDIADKHRELHVIGGGMVVWSVKHHGDAGGAAFNIPTKWIDEAGVVELVDGVQVFGYFAALSPRSRVELDIQASLYFSSPPEVRGRPVITLLRRLTEQTEAVLKTLEDSVGGDSQPA